MKVIIIEDEPLAAERLQLLLGQYDPKVCVIATLESIAQAVRWVGVSEQMPDLLLMDIHLADGSAFEIFRQVNIPAPVIFTTAYDQYAIEAFKVLSVDYLMKPVTLQALATAIDKLKKLRGSPEESAKDYTMLASYQVRENTKFRTRFLGRVGQKFYFVYIKDIAVFLADNKVVQMVGMDNTRYLVDHTLEELESGLDPSVFFRINRSMIVHVAAIEQVKPFINQRLRLYLKGPVKVVEDIIISRERVPSFRKWADA